VDFMLKRWNLFLAAGLILSLWFLFRAANEATPERGQEFDRELTIPRRDLEKYLEIAKETVQKAGKMIHSNLGKNHQKEEKNGQTRNLVTNIDLTSLEFIKHILKTKMPDCEIITDQNGSINMASLTDSPTWIINPLDGTINFVHRYPIVCVSAALLINKEIIVGAVYEVFGNDTFTAMKKGGAYFNGKEIHVSKIQNLEEALISTGFPYSRSGQLFEDILRKFYLVVRAAMDIRKTGSTSFDLCNVAAGRVDAHYEYNLNLLNYIASYLILKEAGGVVESLDNKAPFNLEEKNIVVGNQFIVNKLQQLLEDRA